jgi:hypothetical protein
MCFADLQLVRVIWANIRLHSFFIKDYLLIYPDYLRDVILFLWGLDIDIGVRYLLFF